METPGTFSFILAPSCEQFSPPIIYDGPIASNFGVVYIYSDKCKCVTMDNFSTKVRHFKEICQFGILVLHAQ